jgi:hypothetical protein
MLPDGFYWAPRWQHDRGDNALCLDGITVAFVDTMADGNTWLARLDCHKGMDAPLVTRNCSSHEAGRRGCELWACRHEMRLRREVAEVKARLPANRWCARS